MLTHFVISLMSVIIMGMNHVIRREIFVKVDFINVGLTIYTRSTVCLLLERAFLSKSSLIFYFFSLPFTRQTVEVVAMAINKTVGPSEGRWNQTGSACMLCLSRLKCIICYHNFRISLASGFKGNINLD